MAARSFFSWTARRGPARHNGEGAARRRGTTGSSLFAIKSHCVLRGHRTLGAHSGGIVKVPRYSVALLLAPCQYVSQTPPPPRPHLIGYHNPSLMDLPPFSDFGMLSDASERPFGPQPSLGQPLSKGPLCWTYILAVFDQQAPQEACSPASGARALWLGRLDRIGTLA